MAEENKLNWWYLVVALVVGGVAVFFAFPQTVEVVKTIDNTDFSAINALEGEVLDLSTQLTDKTTLVTETETELANEKSSHAKTLADLEALRELPIERSFEQWVLDLFEEAEDDAELEYNGKVYEGDEGEWDFDEVDAEECTLNWLDDDFDEAVLECDDVEVETDDDDNLLCDFEFDIEDGNEYDDVEITNCILD